MSEEISKKVKRRATAESMAASQRDISVSEFFAKNRHLLGFDNPRKALLTTVKEAVDNSLDACEEAGILPEIWVRIESTGSGRFKVGVQDNGPGILKKQIPLIFGKLLYGSKFHRLRMSRGQQGIGISAAGMYGVLTTGMPVKVISRVSPRNTYYYEIKINTKKNIPEILNGDGEGLSVPAAEKERRECMNNHGIEWIDLEHGTRVTIELEAKYQRGRGSVDEYLEQTAIANPHVRLHYQGPEDESEHLYERSTELLPPEPKEIKPHPYGVELGRMADMMRYTTETTLTNFFMNSFSRITGALCRELATKSGISTKTDPKSLSRETVELLYRAIQEAKIQNPSTDCLTPIGEQLLLKGLHQVVPGEFYAASTRPPCVYRGNPFQVEVALAYGGTPITQTISHELLEELIMETDVRTLRQFLMNTFQGIGSDGADKILKASHLSTRMSPQKMGKKEFSQLHEAMKNVNLSESQAMNVYRYANRVPLQFQPAACAITQTIINMNWRNYGLQQSRGNLPRGPVTVMVHLASVWVPFTSESKEAIASYPEIQTELRLALQAVGRKLDMYLRTCSRVKEQSQRRSQFLRYIGEVATAVARINHSDREVLYHQLLEIARNKTSIADLQLDESGKPIPQEEVNFGDNVLIVESGLEERMIHRNSNRDENASEDETSEIPESEE